MRNLLMRALVGGGLVWCSLVANAQYERPRDYEHRGPGQVLDRVRADLDRAEAATLPFTADRSRINAVREEINVFQRRLADDDYDRQVLSNAIVGIERVIDLNRMSDRTRDFMSDDLARLRYVLERLDREDR